MKRYGSAGLAGVFTLVLVACGGGDAGSDSGASSAAPAPAPAAAPAAPPAAAPAAAPAEDAPIGELPDGVTMAMVTEGETLFASTGLCFSCHGPTGEGVPQLGPNLTDSEWLNTDGTYDGIVGVVTDGVAEPKEAVAPMLARGGSAMSDDQVRAVAAYVYTLSH
ncbi:MAG: cytochrome c [Gemmatimonadota bacterium]|nr:cytochrome c [Gemmatimonadota bacterium]